MDNVILFVRGIGALCVLGASCLFGISLCNRYENKYDEYEGIKQILLKILRNQEYLNRPFPELFKEAAAQLEKSMHAGKILIRETKILGEIIPEVPFEKAWSQYIECICGNMKMKEELKNQLLRLGSILQEMDKEGICVQMQSVLDYLQEDLDEKRRTLKDKKKVSMACSFMVGMFAVILLI